MLYTVEGLVISRRDIGESSCFLDVLTDEMGLLEVSARGVKKVSAKNHAAYSIFSYCTFCVNKTKNNYTLNSVEPKYLFHGLSNDICAFSLANYFCDVMKYCASSEEQQPNLLRLMLISLYRLEGYASHGEEYIILNKLKSVFELRLMAQIGFMPELRVCGFCGRGLDENLRFYPILGLVGCNDCNVKNNNDSIGISSSVFKAMRHIVYSDIEKIFSFSLNKENFIKLQNVCEMYLLNQVGRSFKTLDYYKNMYYKGMRND